MITIWHNTLGDPRVQTGTTSKNLIEDEKIDGQKHVRVNTREARKAAKFLESLHELSSEASSEMEDLLTIIYKMGVRDGKRVAQK